MSSNQSESDIKNSVWYQQHLEKLKNKRKQDAKPSSATPKENETRNSAKIYTQSPSTGSLGGSTAAKISKKDPQHSSNVKYPNWNGAPPCGRGPMYRQKENHKFGPIHGPAGEFMGMPMSGGYGPMFPPPLTRPRHVGVVPGFTPFVRSRPAWQSNSQSISKSRQSNENLSAQGKKVSSTPTDKKEDVAKDTVRTLLEKSVAVKNNWVSSSQPEKNDTTAGKIMKESTKTDGRTVPVEKQTVQRASKPEPQTSAEKKPEQSTPLTKSNSTSIMTSTPVAKDQPLAKVDIEKQIEMVLSKINKKLKNADGSKAEFKHNKVTMEKSDTYLDHKKKLQETVLLQAKPESEIGKLGALVSNALDKPQSDAYLEHLKKLQAKTRPNGEVSSLTGHQSAKPTQVKSPTARKTSRVSMHKPETTKLASYGETSIPITDQQHLKSSQVHSSARTVVASKPTASEKAGINKAAPITIKKELPPCSGGQRPATTGVQSSDKTYATSVTEKTGSIKVTPMQIKKEASPYSTTQPSPTVDKRPNEKLHCAVRQQNPHSAKQSTPVRRSPRGQQATIWGPSLVDDAPSCSSRVQSEPTRHLPISGKEVFLTLDSTFAEDTHEKKNSWTTQRPKSSDFFENSTNRVKTNEQKYSSVAKPLLRSILKRTQTDNKNGKIPAKTQRCDSETRVKPNLPSLEPDAIEVIPSLPQEDDANMRSDNAPAAKLDFIHPVSGYHCVLCNTFYHDYRTVLRHCMLLTHKMKIQKAQSVKYTFKQV